MARTCWAASLGGCATKMSNEHVITEGVFSRLPLRWAGSAARFLAGRESSRANLKAKVLCTTHNSVLHELDDEAIKLATALRTFLAAKEPCEASVRVDGWKIERWCMKCGCNLLASRWLERREFTPDPHMVRIIFGGDRLAADAGMYIVKEPAITLTADADQVGWWLFGHEQNVGAIQAVYIQLHGLGLIVTTHRGDITSKLRSALVQGDGAGMDWSTAEISLRPPSARLALRRAAWPMDATAGLTVEFAW